MGSESSAVLPWKKFVLRSLLVILAASLCPALPAQSIDGRAIDEIVQDSLKLWEVPGASLAIVRNDQLIYLKGYGVKQLGAAGTVTPDTLFAIASTTKAFTTTAMAMLVDERKMDWDDPVHRHLEYFHLSDPLADQNVTLRDLVTHRTGLSRNDALWDRSPWSREEIIRRIALVKPSRPFRTAFQYNNIMFLAAGEAVGKAAGTTWDDFVRRRIFAPLGMNSANFSVAVAEKAADHATPHRKNKQGRVEISSWNNVDNLGGAGCINASARDMSHWLRFQLANGVFNGKRLVSSESLSETHTPQIVVRMDAASRTLNPYTTQMSYGMGWFIQDYRGHRLLSHTGGLNGFRARVLLVPDAQLAMVLLTNSSVGSSSASMHVAATNSLLDLLLGSDRTDWNVLMLRQAGRLLSEERARAEERQEKRQNGTRPSHPLAGYAGTYQEPAYGSATVTLKEGGLELRWNDFVTHLEHFHYETFTVTGNDELEDEQVRFDLDTNGEVARMNFLGMDFVKVKAKP